MPDPWSRRETLRAIGATAALAVGGCLDDGSPGTDAPPRTDESPSDSPTDPPDGDDRPTATERAPRPLSVDGAWPQFASDAAHDGVTAAPALPEDGAPYWHLRRVRSGPPVLADGSLFHYAKLGADEGGRPTLTRTVETPGLSHPVYGESALVARDPADGRIEWSTALPNAGGGWPAVAGDRVVSCVQGQVAVFDVEDGDSHWTVDLGEHHASDPAVADGVVVVPIHGVVDGQSGEYVRRPSIRAYGLDDGEEEWTIEPPKRANALAISDGTVTVVSGGWDGTGVVLGLSLADGTEQWRTETPGDFFTTPVVADGTVYVGSSDDYLRALDLSDGSERWRRDLERRPKGVAVDGETAYVAAGSALSALDTNDGRDRWKVAPVDDSGNTVAPAVGADAVYVGVVGGESPLVALDPSDGSERWRHRFPTTVVDGDQIYGGVEAQPVVAEGGLFVNAVDGLYAFGPDA